MRVRRQYVCLDTIYFLYVEPIDVIAIWQGMVSEKDCVL